MAFTFKDKVKPSDFKFHLEGVFYDVEVPRKGYLIRDIILMCLKNGDQWIEFEFKDYVLYCGNRIHGFSVEKDHLDELVTREIFDRRDGRYSVTENFFRLYARFIS